ncbi:MAG TPA: hypothetical protein VGD51_10505 [Nocardioidaceae bacterium]
MSRRNPFKRSVEVPREVLQVAPLRRGEHVLAGTRSRDGGWLLGTRDALYVVPPRGPGSVDQPSPADSPGEARIPWESIERADWDSDEDRLVVSEVGEFGRIRPQHVFGVSEPGLLLELVRERVTASVVLQRRVLTEQKRGLSVIGRRAPAGGGEVIWAYQFDPGVDPEDPDVVAAAEAGLRAAQDELGL